ncbi:MAG: hypothetical protein IKR04_01575 [Clostridia bacterium]|nr:hypothetical protein [Clostridia bacterium]
MSKRILISILGFVLTLCLCTSAFAISGSDNYGCDAEYVEKGYATFLLDNSGRIAGVLKPNEEIKKLGFQSPSKLAAKYLEDGKAIRRRAFVRIGLDEDFKVIKGGKDIEITLVLYDYDVVASILGDNFLVDDVIDATIYSPNPCSCKPYGAHMFLQQSVRGEKVGKVVFKCGNCLDLYVGDFDGDCDLELGFRAVAQKAPEEEVPGCIEPPDHCGPCRPCHPGCPHMCITTTTDVTTVVTTTVTTTTTVGTGCH